MNKELKRIKQKVDRSLQEYNYQKDDEGRIIVNMNLKDDEKFLSLFSSTETPVINKNVADFIETSTHSIPAKEPLVLKIHSDCITDTEKGIYGKGIKEYYKEKYVANEREIKRNDIISLILILVSIALLTVYLLFKNNSYAFIPAEVINILGWFFLWEAVDIISFKTREMRLKRKKYLSYISMKVEYYPLTKQEEK